MGYTGQLDRDRTCCQLRGIKLISTRPTTTLLTLRTPKEEKARNDYGSIPTTPDTRLRYEGISPRSLDTPETYGDRIELRTTENSESSRESRIASVKFFCRVKS